MWGLHHDDPEAIIADIVRPIKPLSVPTTAQIENRIERGIINRFDIPINAGILEAVRRVDNLMIFLERDALMGRPERPYGNERDHPRFTIFDAIPEFTSGRRPRRRNDTSQAPRDRRPRRQPRSPPIQEPWLRAAVSQAERRGMSEHRTTVTARWPHTPLGTRVEIEVPDSYECEGVAYQVNESRPASFGRERWTARLVRALAFLSQPVITIKESSPVDNIFPTSMARR
jgi:hypothetical protein